LDDWCQLRHDADTNSYPDTNTDSNADADSNANANANAHPNADTVVVCHLGGRRDLHRRTGGQLPGRVVHGAGNAHRIRGYQLESKRFANLVVYRRQLHDSNADANANTNTDANTDANANANANAYTDANTDTNTNAWPGQARAGRLLAQLHQPGWPDVPDQPGQQ